MAGDASRRGVQGQRALRNYQDGIRGAPLMVIESTVSGATIVFCRWHAHDWSMFYS
jgi:hypothetical protein